MGSLEPMKNVKVKTKERTGKIIRRRRWMKIFSVLFILILAIYLIIGTAALGIIHTTMEDAPELSASDFISQESTKIYDADGNVIAEVGTYLRDNISYDACPESLVDAFLSIEDSRFFQHNGFDVPRFLKSALTNLSSGSMDSGGSTFTMQLVKNTYFSIEDGETQTTYSRTVSYKIQQIVLSIEAESVLSKQEIFELYVNKLNFGKNIRGVQRAAQYYFGKNVNELNLSEAALLAGIVNLPNKYNPYEYLDYATSRRNEVLQMMLYHGYITQEEYDLAKSIKVEDQLAGENAGGTGSEEKYQSYIDTVIAEAEEMTGLDPSVKGMQIYTAMEPAVQEEIEAIQNGETEVWYADDLMQSAIISMNNQTGEIIGIGAGRCYTGGRAYNRATDGNRQPGSSVKPVLSYALGFEYLGYSLDEILLDEPITLPGETKVLVNATGTYAGDVTIKDAVAYSLNIPAILTLEKVVDQIGTDPVVQYLQSLGFSQVTAENFEYRFAIGGNSFYTTVLELAGAHAAMINGGVYNQPHTIKYIETTTGERYEPQNQNQQVLSGGSAWMVTQLMQNNVEANVGNYMEILQRDYPVYAKTGTTDWGDSGLAYGIPEGASKDKWMVSSTSQYTNAVWVGWDQAVAGEETYFSSWKSSLNIPGNISRLLLDAEEQCTDAESLNGVERPEDVEEVTYVYGTYPHVEADDTMSSSSLITSQVSSAGLSSQPSISRDEYSDGTASLRSISASLDGTALSITWNTTGTASCSGSTRNISLYDGVNTITAYGACLADYTWLRSGSSAFAATVYLNDLPVQTIYSRTGYASIELEGEGTVKVCGTVSGQEACTVAGELSQPEAEPEDPASDEEGESPETTAPETAETVPETSDPETVPDPSETETPVQEDTQGD